MKILGILVLIALVIWVIVEVVKCFKGKKSVDCCAPTPAVRPLSEVLPAKLNPGKVVIKKPKAAKKKTTAKKPVKK